MKAALTLSGLPDWLRLMPRAVRPVMDWTEAASERRVFAGATKPVTASTHLGTLA